MQDSNLKIREFANRAGVTVKALRHYERLGLLAPMRPGESRYRDYAQRDLERVDQVAALKLAGLTLRQIKDVFAGKSAAELGELLRGRRITLEQERRRLDHAILALRVAEASANPLERMLEMMNEPDDHDAPEWAELRRDVALAIARGEDPAGKAAQSLADRWLLLWRQRPSPRHQPHAEMREFLKRVAENARRRYFESEAAWERFARLRREGESMDAEAVSRHWQASVDLFQEIENALNVPEPDAARLRELRARWRAHVDKESAGDPAIRAALERAWTDRANWPATLRWRMEGQYMMVAARFDRVAAFVSQS